MKIYRLTNDGFAKHPALYRHVMFLAFLVDLIIASISITLHLPFILHFPPNYFKDHVNGWYNSLSDQWAFVTYIWVGKDNIILHNPNRNFFWLGVFLFWFFFYFSCFVVYGWLTDCAGAGLYVDNCV